PPGDDARPSERAPEGATPKGAAPSGPSDLSSDDSRKSTQKRLKCLAPACAHEHVDVRSDVGKIVNPDARPPRAGAHGVANFLLVSQQRPWSPSCVAVQSDMHGAPHANRSLGLPVSLTLATPVPGSTVERGVSTE